MNYEVAEALPSPEALFTPALEVSHFILGWEVAVLRSLCPQSCLKSVLPNLKYQISALIRRCSLQIKRITGKAVYDTKKAAKEAASLKKKQNRVLAKQGELPIEYITKYLWL